MPACVKQASHRRGEQDGGEGEADAIPGEDDERRPCMHDHSPGEHLLRSAPHRLTLDGHDPSHHPQTCSLAPTLPHDSLTTDPDIPTSPRHRSWPSLGMSIDSTRPLGVSSPFSTLPRPSNSRPSSRRQPVTSSPPPLPPPARAGLWDAAIVSRRLAGTDGCQRTQLFAFSPPLSDPLQPRSLRSSRPSCPSLPSPSRSCESHKFRLFRH